MPTNHIRRLDKLEGLSRKGRTVCIVVRDDGSPGCLERQVEREKAKRIREGSAKPDDLFYILRCRRSTGARLENGNEP
jgi:hypothetical protein